ncbi:uncharacterized protein LOC132718710 [Ruditapes philippinarum]|uniref:uncharacterized protein LOC132718710 n=1 Tax=Ruditapes philippinarum TaxID=129788 RepID=UPI00295BDA3D|nr:uncharacterized protein LOC132718710 [Ruditapes philippinarum]
MILYDDATLGTRPTKIIRGENRTALLLCFDIDVSQDKTFQHLLNVYEWNMLPVERTNRVQIKGVSMETTPEDVKDYFNKKLSNDVSITSMVYREHLGDYIATFPTIHDAERVVNQEINSINGKEIDVTYYYPYLEDEDAYIFNIPQSKKMQHVDKDICWYLQNSNKYRKELEKSVESHHGKVRWPSNEVAYMEVMCNVDERDRKAKIKVEEWEEHAASAVLSVCRKLSVHHSYFALEVGAFLFSRKQNKRRKHIILKSSICFTSSTNQSEKV